MFTTLGIAVFSITSFFGGGLIDAIKEGSWKGDFRLRLENVDQDGMSEDALAFTLRSRLGFKTGDFGNFNFYMEFEDITSIGDEDFNDTKNGNSEYPVVADPSDTELNRLHLNWKIADGHAMILGRQRIILDNARFIGNVGFRQNEQTYDAALYQFKADSGLTFTGVYVANANRIFGAHHPADLRANIRQSTFLLHGNYKFGKIGKLSGFAHLVDLEEAIETASHRNIGLYWKGAVGGDVKFLSEASYVMQDDYADGGEHIDAEYTQLALGAKFGAFAITANNEILGGDGTYGFQTQFATAHAFQGWADKFLSTPGSGVNDLYLKAVFAKKGWKAILMYHQFESDEGSIDYGDEMDFVLNRVINKNNVVGLKYADYSADEFSVDTTKIWAYYNFKF